ncbi:MAG: hypothetical protein R3B06_30990 [Kofleriaceae bacterium]
MSGDPTPAITSVRFPQSENGAVPPGPFSSLWEADAALARAFREEPPPPGGAYDKTWFVVEWADGEIHEGRVDVTAAMVAKGGGMLRDHLATYAAWLTSERYVAFRSGRPPGEIRQAQAWGLELIRRLTADLANLGTEPGPRNAGDGARYAGHGVPTLEPWRAAARWLTFLPNPATLRPDPTATDGAITAALDQLEAQGALEWTSPQINALVNWITEALRADLPTVDAGDAAVIWMQWAAAVREFRERRNGRTLKQRLTALLWNVFTALNRPTVLWSDFCPWRSAYFDRDRLEPASIGHNPKRSPLEIDPWRI